MIEYLNKFDKTIYEIKCYIQKYYNIEPTAISFDKEVTEEKAL